MVILSRYLQVWGFCGQTLGSLGEAPAWCDELQTDIDILDTECDCFEVFLVQSIKAYDVDDEGKRKGIYFSI